MTISEYCTTEYPETRSCPPFAEDIFEYLHNYTNPRPTTPEEIEQVAISCTFRLLPPANEVAGKVTFSLSVCLHGVICDHYRWYFGSHHTGTPCPCPVHPFCTRTSPAPIIPVIWSSWHLVAKTKTSPHPVLTSGGWIPKHIVCKLLLPSTTVVVERLCFHRHLSFTCWVDRHPPGQTPPGRNPLGKHYPPPPSAC